MSLKNLYCSLIVNNLRYLSNIPKIVAPNNKELQYFSNNNKIHTNILF